MNKGLILIVAFLSVFETLFSQSTTNLGAQVYTPGTRTVTAEIINSQEDISGSQQVTYTYERNVKLSAPFKVHGLSTTGKFQVGKPAATNSVLGFNGITDNVSLGSVCLNGARTIEFWFMPAVDVNTGIGVPGYTLLMRNTFNVQDEIGFYIKGTDWTNDRGNLCFMVRSAGAIHEIKSDGNSWSAGTWYHVCGTIDPSGGMKLFINGNVQANTDAAVTSVIATGTNNAMLAVWGDFSIRRFAGKMDEVRVWSRSVVEQEVQNNMCACMNVTNQSGLQAYWKFNEGTGSIGNDAAPNNYLAAVNAVWDVGNVSTDPGSSCNRMNEFKIGMMGSYNIYDQTIAPYNGQTTTTTYNGQNTSHFNVLKEDGFNIAHHYGSQDNLDNGTYARELDLIKLNNLLSFVSAPHSYRAIIPIDPSTSLPYATSTLQANNSYWYTASQIQGAADYTGRSCSGLPLYGTQPQNINNLFDVILPDPKYSNVVWGIQTNEEGAMCHEQIIYSSTGCYPWHAMKACGEYGTNGSGDIWYQTELDPNVVKQIRDHYDASLTSHGLDVKLVSMEAGHGIRLDLESNDPTTLGKWSIKPIDFVKNMVKTNKRHVFFESSYPGIKPIIQSNTDASFNSWDIANFQDAEKGHYLNKFENLELAKPYVNEIHSVIDNGPSWSDGPGAFNIGSTQVHSRQRNGLANADYMWFQAYNSIIHGVSGVWFYCTLAAYDANDQEDIAAQSAPGLSIYDAQNFPKAYKNYSRYLARELAYLKNNGFLNTDNSSEVYSFSPNTSNNNIFVSNQWPQAYSDYLLPPDCGTSQYCCENSEAFNCTSLKDRGIQSFWDDNSSDPRYGIRYTVRTNGNDVILIATNPMPFGMAVTFDFSCATNDVIANSTGLDMLFSTEQWDGAGGNNTNNDAIPYKINRDGLVDLVNNTVGIQQYLAYGAGTKRTSINMGPFDAVVFKFHKSSTPPVSTNNGFTKFWSNQGNNKIGNWTMRPTDKYYPGDFNGDGKKNELLCAQDDGNWISLLQFDGSNWNSLWSNYGNVIGMSPYRMNFYVGDFDGNGSDDLLGDDGSATGWVTFFSYENSDWQWKWSTGGNSHPIKDYQKLVVGDYDGDGKDEILGFKFQYGGCAIFKWSSWNDFAQLWNRPYGGSGMDELRFDPMISGDFDNDGRDEIASLSSYDYMIDFNGDFTTNNDNFIKSEDRATCPAYNLNGWALPEAPIDIMFSGNIDNVDNNDELVQMSYLGYMQTNSLNSNYTTPSCSSIWTSHNWADPNASYGPYLDNFYIPTGTPVNDQGSSFSCNGFARDGILIIRKNCLGLCNIYYSNNDQLNYRQTENNQSANTGSTSQDAISDKGGKMSLYPNPANDQLTVSYEFNTATSGTYLLDIYNYSGSLVYQNKNAGVNTSIDLSNFANGMYTVILTGASEVKRKTFVVQR